jgi:hypothetical protein
MFFSVPLASHTSTHRVAFHASGLPSEHPPQGTPLIFPNVRYNDGGGYNSSNGYFVVPTQGVYFIISTTANRYAGDIYFWLRVDDQTVANGYSFGVVSPYNSNVHYNGMATVHAILPLREGQRVSVIGGSATGSVGFWERLSVFSGFLLFSDVSHK